MSIKLVASDLDGTLLDSGKEASPYLQDVINELGKRGIIFVAASGRSKDSIQSYFERGTTAIIANNGGAAYTREGNLLAAKGFSYTDAKEVLETAWKTSYMRPVLTGLKNTYVQSDESKEHKKFSSFYFNGRVEFVPDLKEVFYSDTIIKISMNTGGHGKNEKQGLELLEQFADRFSLTVSGDGWVDLMGKGVSKGSALERICGFYNIAREETIVFGDYVNDMEMMLYSPNSYAMANAHPRIKDICSKVLLYTNDQDGVVRELCDIFGIYYKEGSV